MITFVIAAYKESPYLEELIISLKAQTIPCELAISTSTPNEFIRNLARKYQIDKIFINPNPKHTLVDDMNFALSCAKTKYCIIAHQDDLYTKDFADKLLKEAEKYQDNLITFSFYSELINNNTIYNSKLLKIKSIILGIAFRGNSCIRNKFIKKMMLSLGSPIPCPAVMFNLKNIGEFNFSEEFMIDFDWNAWLGLSQKDGSFIFVNEPLMIHRLHDNSTTFQGIKDNRRYLEDKTMFAKFWYFPFNTIISFLFRLSYKANLDI